MGQPIDEAFVVIRADADKFEPELERQVDGALESVERAVDSSMRQVEKSIDDAGKDAGRALSEGIGDGADSASDALDGVEREARESLRGVEDAADDAADELEQLDRKIEEVERSLRELNREFARTGDEELFPKITKDRALIAQLRRVRRELDDVGDTLHGVGDDVDRTTRRVGSALDRTARRIRNLATVGISARSAIIGALVVGLAAATPSALGLAAALVSTAGAAALLPAALGAGAAAVGTLKLAMTGLEDAFKAVAEGDADKLNEALKELAPAARSFVKEIDKVKPSFDKMRLGVQQELFAGLSQHVSKLATLYLPILSTQLGGIAAEFNDAGIEVAKFLESSQAVSDVNLVLSNSKVAIGELTDAIQPLIKALLGVGVVGSTFLPALAEAAGDAAERFAQWVSEARESGQLEDIITGALTVLKQLGALAADVWGIISGIFSAAESGGGALGVLGQLADTLNKVVNSAGGQAGLAAVFTGLSQIASALGPVLASVAAGLGPLTAVIAPLLTALGPGLTALIDGLAVGLAALAPAAEPVGKAISAVAEALAPVLPLIGQLLGSLLPPLAQVLTIVAEALAPVIKIFIRFVQDALKQVEPLLPPIVKLIGQVAAILGDTLAQILPIVLGLWMKMASAIMPLIPIVLQLVEALLPLLPPILELVTSLLGPLAELLGAILPPIIGLLAPILKLVTLIVGWLIEKAIVPLVEFISGVLVGILEALVGDFDKVGNAAKTVGGWFVWLWENAIKPAVDAIAAAAVWLWENAIKPAWDGIVAGIQFVIGAFAALANVVRARIAQIVAVAGRVAAFVAVIRNHFASVVKAVRDRISNVVSTVRGLPGKITSAVGNLGRLLYGQGRKVIQGLIDGIKSMIGSVGKSMGDIASKIKKYLPFSPAELGPLSGSGDPMISGEHIAQMLADGIHSQVRVIEAAAAEMAAAARIDTITSAGSGALDVALADRITAATRGGDGAAAGFAAGPDDRGGDFVGELYLDTGQFLGVVHGEIRKRDRDLKRRVKQRTGAI